MGDKALCLVKIFLIQFVYLGDVGTENFNCRGSQPWATASFLHDTYRNGIKKC